MESEEIKKLHLIREIIEAAKEVKRLGGGKTRFVTYDERRIMRGGQCERKDK